MDTIGVSFLDPLNDYELIHRVGSGTYGDVFKVSAIPRSLLICEWLERGEITHRVAQHATVTVIEIWSCVV